MKLIIVRHGDPDYSIDSLTEKGKREAQLLVDRMKKINPTYCYCSPYGRAKDTAKYSLDALNMEAEIFDWMREFDCDVTLPSGITKNHCWDIMPKDFVSKDEFFTYDNWYDGYVSHDGLNKRYNEVVNGLDELLSKHGYNRDGKLYKAVKPNADTVVLFCHFGVESIMLSHLLNIPPLTLLQGTIALPTSVTTLCTDERQDGIASFRMSSFGDISHLYVADEPPAFSGRFCELYTNTEERH